MPSTQVNTPEVEGKVVAKEVESPVKKSVVIDENIVVETGDKVIEIEKEVAEVEESIGEKDEENVEDNVEIVEPSENGENTDSIEEETVEPQEIKENEPVEPEEVKEETNGVEKTETEEPIVEETEVENIKRKSLASEEEEPEVSPKKLKTSALNGDDENVVIASEATA